MARLSLSRQTLGLAALALLGAGTARADIQYGQLPDNATPEDPLGLRNDPALNFGETKGALGSRLTDGCNVKNAKYGHLYGCGLAIETPGGLNVGAGADVMADGSVKMGIGAGIGGEGVGAGCEVRPDGSLHCGKGSSLLGQQGFVAYGDPAAQAIAAQASTAAHLAALQGQEHVQVDPEYKPGTLHLNVDQHDFHEVITGHSVYVPPDLAAQQEAYYARKAAKQAAAAAAAAAAASAPAAANAPATDAPAAAVVAAPAAEAPVQAPATVAAVVEEKEEEEGPAATKAALPGKPSGDFEIIKGGAAPPAAPEPTGEPRTYEFKGVVPPPTTDAKRAFEYPEGSVPTVVGSIRLSPKLGVKLWHVAGATVVVNMTRAVVSYPGSLTPVTLPALDVPPAEIASPKVSEIKAMDPALADALYFVGATLALSEPENLPTPLPERVTRVAFTSDVTVKESVLAETGDEELSASLPTAADAIAFKTMWIIYGPLDDLAPIKQMSYAHMDLTNAIPVMNTVPAPKLLLKNVGVVVRRVPPTAEEAAADTLFLTSHNTPPVAAATPAAAAPAPVDAALPPPAAAAAAPAVAADPAAGAVGGAAAVVPAVVAAKDAAVVEAPEIEEISGVDVEETPKAPVATVAGEGDQRVVALPISEDGQILPEEPMDESEAEAPTAPAPPRAADALPRGAVANKPALRASAAGAARR